MTPTSRRVALTVLGWLVAAAVLAATVVALRGRWEDVVAAGGLPGAGPIAIAVAANVVANLTLALGWRDVLGLAGRRLRTGVTLWVWGASQLARYTLGAAQIGGRAVLARRYGVSAPSAAVTSVVETAWQTSLNAGVLLATLPWWLGAARGVAWVAWTAVVPAALLVTALIRPSLLVRGARRVARLPWLTRNATPLAAAELVVSRRSVARITLWFVANTGLRIAAFLVLLEAVGADAGAVGLRAVGAYMVGKIVGQVAVFVPAGIGPREGATVLVLGPAIGGGAALALVAVVRLCEIVAEVMFVGIARLAVVRGRGATG